MTLDDVVSDAVHELRGTIGSIRLLITSLIDDGDDPEYRMSMLTKADAEVLRLSHAVGALPALIRATTDLTPTEPVDLEAACAKAGIRVEGASGVVVMARSLYLADVLSSMCGVVPMEVVVNASGGATAVSFPPSVRVGEIATGLAEAVGAASSQRDGALVWTFVSAT
jgi:hypothetical protein